VFRGYAGRTGKPSWRSLPPPDAGTELAAQLGTDGEPLQICELPSKSKTGSLHWLLSPQTSSYEQRMPLAAHDCPRVAAVMQVLVFVSQKLPLAQA